MEWDEELYDFSLFEIVTLANTTILRFTVLAVSGEFVNATLEASHSMTLDFPRLNILTNYHL